MDKLTEPPTEVEISDTVRLLNLCGDEGRKLAAVVRRLAFQRDQLKRQLEEKDAGDT